MTTTLTSSDTIPQVSGNDNVTNKSIGMSPLVIIHAIFLGGSFLILFPLGIIALRWFKWVRVHWMLQIFATGVCLAGLIIAIVFSHRDAEYNTFNQGHQIVGIIVVIPLFVQALLGYKHHRDYKKTAQKTIISTSHIWLGRTLVVMGMVNIVV